MNIAWNQFSPGLSFAGGLAIGLATALLILGSGRVAGISDIVGGALKASLHGLSIGHQAVRWAFIAGLLVSPWLWSAFAPLPVPRVEVGPAALIGGGLLVGFGVRMGKGCTSGHGVCGLSQFSLRSLANVLAFMGAGVAMVFVLRHVL